MPNKWLQHIAQYRKSHPGISLKKAMQEAKKTYKKGSAAPAKKTRRKKAAKGKKKLNAVEIHDPLLNIECGYQNADIVFICTPSENVEEYLKEAAAKEEAKKATISTPLIDFIRYEIFMLRF